MNKQSQFVGGGHVAEETGVPASQRVNPSGDNFGVLVNDVHSQLNPTRVHRLVAPRSLEGLQSALRDAANEDRAVSMSGGRHAMGGQQFGAGSVLLDISRFNQVLSLDAREGLVEVQSGIQWRELIEGLHEVQSRCAQPWSIRQKQTGADRLSIGGALSANIHGRGLRYRPVIADVESFDLIDASGIKHHCSRSENAELFSLAIGGYGLFGVIANVSLRLIRRHKVQRIVELIDAKDLMSSFEDRIHKGFEFGDFQFSTAAESDDFLRKGVFSCYRPVDKTMPIAGDQKIMSETDWRRLIYMAHTNRSLAFETYSKYYLSTSGQIYWSDTHQMSMYLDDYHRELDCELHARQRATEMITEIYVPRNRLNAFLDDVRNDFRKHKVELIYGTIRLIEKDDESFLAWAREPFACVIFNLHTEHTKEALAKTATDFRRLIDRGICHEGSFFLTYHRWATREQIERCHPRFVEFLKLKRKYDPDERFQSDWYRHYREMFADRL